jgi:hypothetical protein
MNSWFKVRRSQSQYSVLPTTTANRSLQNLCALSFPSVPLAIREQIHRKGAEYAKGILIESSQDLKLKTLTAPSLP